MTQVNLKYFLGSATAPHSKLIQIRVLRQMHITGNEFSPPLM